VHENEEEKTVKGGEGGGGGGEGGEGEEGRREGGSTSKMLDTISLMLKIIIF